MSDHNPAQYSCDGKRRYQTWRDAVKVARVAARRRNGDAPTLVPYHCHWCAGVHLYSVDSVERRKRLSGVEYHS